MIEDVYLNKFIELNSTIKYLNEVLSSDLEPWERLEYEDIMSMF